MPSKEEITQLLTELNAGKAGAEEALLPLVYDELHALAQHFMRSERPGHTLQATALVHEAYIRLGGNHEESFKDRTHYFRVAARAMRHVLVDHGRRKSADKRGGGAQREPLELENAFIVDETVDLVALDIALKKLAEEDSDLAQLVELRYFGGLTVNETAEVLGVSPRTVMYDWKMAKMWLKRELG